MDLKNYITSIRDFPKKGVSFRDISPLLADYEARKTAVDELVSGLDPSEIDVVVGIESRGFLLGMLMADRLKARFVMVRKPGKLPGKLATMPYELEYGMDTLEVQTQAIEKGSRVLLHDDVLATGGTARAAAKLIDKIGAEVVMIRFLIELKQLNGADRLKGYPYQSVIKF